ncbi:hypothetical protein Glove_352g13 [Diversispora epigaea]|uniref:TLDc domain-containing protein n=1 Tax=Diversispora epigaea TaxID=1348612 RepID=A0A397HBR8_9GLOM|nr:hypothetical protein Glove_352g13 [Diversispora epigaea]
MLSRIITKTISLMIKDMFYQSIVSVGTEQNVKLRQSVSLIRILVTPFFLKLSTVRIRGNNFKDLEKFYINIAAKYPSLIFDAKDFTSLQEPALISLLKKNDWGDNLRIYYKMGIFQNSTLLFNPKEWVNENFTTFLFFLRGSINGFAPQTFCHGHASTVAIMKVKGTEETLGRYNPEAWDAK